MQRRRRETMRVAGRTTFHGKVVIEERELALQHAMDETGLPLDERLVFWTDGSRFRKYGLSGAGVVFTTPNCAEWVTKSFTLQYGLYSGSEDTELFAIKSAIDIAVETFAGYRRAGQSEPALSKLVIYNDCSSVLTNIASWEPYTVYATYVREPLFRHISKMSGRLQDLGIQIELRWVPGHSEVPGNELAHRIAQAAAYASHSSASDVVACNSESTGRIKPYRDLSTHSDTWAT